MAIKAPKNETNYEPAPAGNHVARCYRVIHIGTIQETYMGEEKMVNKIVLGFELPLELKEFSQGDAPKPFTIFREYTLSMFDKSNLFKLVTGILGKSLDEVEAEAFDFSELIGKTCMLNVVHETGKVSGKLRAVIHGAAPLPKGIAIPDAVNDAQVLDYEKFDDTLFDSLPDFLKEKIVASEEYKALKGDTDLTQDAINNNAF